MANVVTSERLWTLDTVAVIKAAGVEVIVRKIVFAPAVAGDDVVIQEYGPDGVARNAIVIKANAADISLVALDWGRNAPTQIDDLKCTRAGLSGTLRFGTDYVWCAVPWESVVAIRAAKEAPAAPARSWTPVVLDGGKGLPN